MTARIPELDGVRGLAILLVLVWHYAASRVQRPGPQGFLSEVWTLSGLTWSGVDLFFVLSGFLIGGVLLDNRDTSNLFRVFYLRRVCRIFPLYFLAVLAFFSVVALGGDAQARNLRWTFSHPLPFWSYASFTQNWVMTQNGTFGAHGLGVTWSLAVEEQFYLLLPLLVRYVSWQRLPYVLLLSILAAPVVRIGFYLFHPTSVSGGYVLMPCRADALMLGVLVAYAVRTPALLRSLIENRCMILGFWVTLFLGVFFLTLTTPGWLTPQMTYWGRTWLALFYAAFLLLPILNRDGLLAAVLRLWPLQKLGIISYGVYLLHLPVLGLTYGLLFNREPKALDSPDLWPTCLAFAVTVALCSALYQLIEKPIVRIGHSYRYATNHDERGSTPVTTGCRPRLMPAEG